MNENKWERNTDDKKVCVTIRLSDEIRRVSIPHNNTPYTNHRMVSQTAVRMHAMTKYLAGATENSFSIEAAERHQSVLRSRPIEKELISVL